MRTRPRWMLAPLLLLFGCGGTPEPGEDASVAPDAGVASDAGPTTSDAGPADAGPGALDAGPGGSDAGPVAACPAPAPAAGEVVVLDDTTAAGWSFAGAAPGAEIQAEVVCSGTAALRYAARNPSGEFLQLINDASAIDAGRVQLRVHVDVDSAWTAAVYQNPIPMGLPTSWEGTLLAGWNLVELDVPAGTTMANRIALFKVDAGMVTVTVDDVRLTPR